MTRSFAHDPAPTIARSIPREPGHTPFYIRRVGESIPDFIVRIKASGQLPYLVEDPKPSTGRPVGRPRKNPEPRS